MQRTVWSLFSPKNRANRKLECSCSTAGIKIQVFTENLKKHFLRKKKKKILIYCKLLIDRVTFFILITILTHINIRYNVTNTQGEKIFSVIDSWSLNSNICGSYCLLHLLTYCIIHGALSYRKVFLNVCHSTAALITCHCECVIPTGNTWEHFSIHI